MSNISGVSRVKYIGKLSTPINRKLLHTHDYHELVRYTAGHGQVDIADKTYEFFEGDIFIIPPHVPHTDYSEDGFQNYHCEFSEPGFPADLPVIFKDSESNDILTILTLMFNECHQMQRNYGLQDSLFTVLLQYVSDLCEARHRNHPYVDFAIDKIIQNYSDPYYDFSSTMREIPFQSDHFRRLFCKDTGCTPTQYLTEKRIQNAKKLLKLRKQSKLSIREIAWLSGFRDNLYFSRVFRIHVGVAPKEYRQSEKQKKP